MYSFKSYAEKVLKTHGGVAVATLSDAARTVAVRRAMDILGDAVQLYRRHRRGVNFCNMCAQAIEELKIAGAAPQDLWPSARPKARTAKAARAGPCVCGV